MATLQEKKLQILSRINQMAVAALVDELAAASYELEELKAKAAKDAEEKTAKASDAQTQ